jgi:RNA binding exosome subunit
LKGPIRTLEVTYLLHTTEDPEKVRSALTKVLSMEAIPEIEHMEGHYGNMISRARVHLTGDDAQKAFDAIVGTLGNDEKKELMGDLGSHLDEHSALFLRFDKQRLVSGSLSFGDADPVRVKVKPRPFLLGGDAARFYSNLLRG